MQLKKKAIRCQKLGADKTLSFGCIVKDGLEYKTISYDFDDSGGFYDRKRPNYYWVEFAKYSGNFSTGRIKDACTIYGHPLNRGRLWYLHRSNNDRKDRNAFDKMLNAFNKKIELYNQTILDRQHNNELMNLIETFLLSLQK